MAVKTDPKLAGTARRLFGIDSDLLTEDAVMIELRSRLEVINASPLADTGEADEVRMLLHAAAARLLGALQRRTPTDQPPARDGVQPLHAALAMGGGWTRDSIRQIAMMARANGLDPAMLERLELTPAPMTVTEG